MGVLNVSQSWENLPSYDASEWPNSDSSWPAAEPVLWKAGGAMLTSKDVLVVDDDRDVCTIIQDVLESEGCRVTVAHNGVEALKVLDQHKPDLILLDLMMPVMDGWEVLAQLQRQPLWQDIPVVVVSANLRSRRPAKPAVAALPKPFDITELTQVVERYAA
jgi:CheY-like chemotaxis protein